VDPLAWAAANNQVQVAFFLLLAFYFLLRYVETGDGRYYLYQWIAFLLGFGALEVNIVYPALAAVYVFLFARKYLVRTNWAWWRRAWRCSRNERVTLAKTLLATDEHR
jgi:hypothetical protein